MARIVLDHINKSYPNGFVAARDVSLDITNGERLVLVGPSRLRGDYRYLM